MKFLSILLSIFSGLFLITNITIGQQAIVSTGIDAFGSGGSACYSVGQMAFTSVDGDGGSMAQGVQQPYEILITTSFKEDIYPNTAINVFPNPTNDFIKLTIEGEALNKPKITLVDVSSRVISRHSLIGQALEIDVKNLANGIYFLIISDRNQNYQTFKIAKN